MTNAPVVRLVNSIITHAEIAQVIFTSSRGEMYVRFRIAAICRRSLRTAVSAHPAIVTRIKIIGGMDISEKRIPRTGGWRSRLTR